MSTIIKIEFLHTIIEPANGDQPEFLLARQGDWGIIRKHINEKIYSIYWDKWFTAPFTAEIDKDFKILTIENETGKLRRYSI